MVAQLVEHLVVVQKVEGSIPFHQPNAGVAHLVEQEFCKLQVVGSIPITSSKQFNIGTK